METRLEQTLVTLRETLRVSKEVREAARERGNFDFVAREDESIARLEQRLAELEARELGLATRAPGAQSDDASTGR